MTCALLHAMFFPGATSSVLAADGGIWLRQEKMSPGGSYEFFFEANAGQTYPIAVSLDLLNWTLLTNAPAQGPSLRIHDEDASKFQQRFYRIGALPTPITNMVFIPPALSQWEARSLRLAATQRKDRRRWLSYRVGSGLGNTR